MFVQLLELKEGDRVKLHDGTIVEIVVNHEDGIWVETKPVEPSPTPQESTTMTHCQEIAEIVR